MSSGRIARVGAHLALKNVFDLEGAVFEDKKLLSNLTSIRLEGLPELEHIWIGPTKRINLHNLQSVGLYKCNKLKFLFEPAIARRLPRLEELEVRSCDMLEVIVAAADEQERVGNEAAEEKMVFPELTSLCLEDLPNLNAFSMGNFSFEWPSLEQVFIWKCPKMKTFTCDECEVEVFQIQKHFKEFYEEAEAEPTDDTEESEAEPTDDTEESETTSSD